LKDKLEKLKDDEIKYENILENVVMEFFKEKYDELKTNEIYLHILIDNFENIRNIVYFNIGVKIILNKDSF